MNEKGKITHETEKICEKTRANNNSHLLQIQQLKEMNNNLKKEMELLYTLLRDQKKENKILIERINNNE